MTAYAIKMATHPGDIDLICNWFKETDQYGHRWWHLSSPRVILYKQVTPGQFQIVGFAKWMVPAKAAEDLPVKVTDILTYIELDDKDEMVCEYRKAISGIIVASAITKNNLKLGPAEA